MHEAVTPRRSFYKKAGVLTHCPQKFFDLALDVGMIFFPIYPLYARPLLPKFSIDLSLGSNSRWFVLMQPVGELSKQASQIPFIHQRCLGDTLSNAPSTRKRV